jgi:hypothetical protein
MPGAEHEHPADALVEAGRLRQRLDLLLRQAGMGCSPLQVFNLECGEGDQGLMLLSQFSAIFDNFRRKNWAFFSKTNVIIKILHNIALF